MPPAHTTTVLAFTMTSSVWPFALRAIAATPVTRPFEIVTRWAAQLAIIVVSPRCASRRKVSGVDCLPPTRQPYVQYPHCAKSHPCALRAKGDHSYPSAAHPRCSGALFRFTTLSFVETHERSETKSSARVNRSLANSDEPDFSLHSSRTVSGVFKHPCQFTVVPPPKHAP